MVEWVFNSSDWSENLQSEKYTNAIKSLSFLVQINVKSHIHTAYTHFNRNMQIVTHWNQQRWENHISSKLYESVGTFLYQYRYVLWTVQHRCRIVLIQTATEVTHWKSINTHGTTINCTSHIDADMVWKVVWLSTAWVWVMKVLHWGPWVETYQRSS